MKIDDEMLESLLEDAKKSPRLRKSFDLRTTPEDNSQRILNALIPGTVLPIHRHPSTAETVILIKGCIDEVFYDAQKNETNRFHLDLSQGGCVGLQVPQGVWHSVEVHEPSVIVEMKDGAYQPVTSDNILE